MAHFSHMLKFFNFLFLFVVITHVEISAETHVVFSMRSHVRYCKRKKALSQFFSSEIYVRNFNG